MTIEQDLAAWATSATYEHLPSNVVAEMKLLTRTIIGTAAAGSMADGVVETVQQVTDWGGKPESTLWFHGGKAPAHAAVLANSVMARALDICDAAVPGQHIGSSLVPVVFAMAEQVGGITGKDFIAAMAVGTEISMRLGMISRLDGFDPTSACSIFAPCVAAGRILQLSEKQMLNAMALIFNKAGGSFQSNVDASLAVRLIQGFVSQDAVICAQLAKRNITGPAHWVSGVWGYFHLFCNGERDEAILAGRLGEEWYLRWLGYKTYPQCGATISSTDAVLKLLKTEPIEPEDVERIDIRMANEGPCALVGSEFRIGDNPQVNGQFSVAYCVANAIARKTSELQHFTNEAVSDPRIGALARRVHVHLAPELAEGKRELAARVALEIHLKDGRVLNCGADGPSGFPPNPKTEAQHRADFDAQIAYGRLPLPAGNIEEILGMIENLEMLTDVRDFTRLLVSPSAQ